MHVDIDGCFLFSEADIWQHQLQVRHLLLQLLRILSVHLTRILQPAKSSLAAENLSMDVVFQTYQRLPSEQAFELDA
jgi:hypothetical protein